jgi:hypothetical protein
MEEPKPQDVGAIAWTVNPNRCFSISQFPGSTLGKLLLFTFMSGPGGVVSNLSYGVVTAGAGLTNSFLGLYDMAGNLLGTTADQSANMMTVGSYTAALVSPVTLTPGTLYRVGLLNGAATTSPVIAGLFVANGLFTNLGITQVNNYLAASVGSGYTALPSTYTPSALASLGGGIACVMT